MREGRRDRASGLLAEEAGRAPGGAGRSWPVHPHGLPASRKGIHAPAMCQTWLVASD